MKSFENLFITVDKERYKTIGITFESGMPLFLLLDELSLFVCTFVPVCVCVLSMGDKVLAQRIRYGDYTI